MQVSEMYAKWLDMGVHVVTPNKKVRQNQMKLQAPGSRM